MRLETLIRKLQPLVPAKADHWLKVLEAADPEARALVQSDVMHHARRHLGEFRSKLLLSLPTSSKAKGPIGLGAVVYEKDKWAAGLRSDELVQHVGIFGRSGSGKTNTAFHLLLQLAKRRVPVLFLDWKRNGRDLLPHLKKAQLFTPGRSLSPFPFNPFAVPPGADPGAYANHVVDLLADTHTLGDGARSILQRALRAAYSADDDAPNVRDLLRRIDAFEGKERVQNWKISAIRALESLRSGLASGGGPREDSLSTLLGGVTILELDSLSSNTKRFLIPLICFWLYSLKLASSTREKLSLVIFLEEAHNVLLNRSRQAHEPLMETLLRQAREVGIGFVLIDQQPSMMSAAALGNTFATICLNQKDPRDLKRAAELSLVPVEDRDHLSRLPVGHGVVKLQDRWTRPFLVRFPHVPIRKGAIDDVRLRKWTGSGRKTALAPRAGQVRQVRFSDTSLNDDGARFLLDVTEHPNDGVRVRYMRLGLSADKGNRIKRELVSGGLLETATVPVGRSRKVLLRVSKPAATALGLSPKNCPGRGSIIHEYWKHYYAEAFAQRGYRVQLEAPRRRGRVDVLATNQSERVAIEIETGKSDAVGNVRNCLLSRFDRVLVVGVNRPAFEKVEMQIARAGLLIPRRVRVVVHQADVADRNN